MKAGARVGKYVIESRIAQGGMAEVWAARVEGPQDFTKQVALKFILDRFDGDTESRRRQARGLAPRPNREPGVVPGGDGRDAWDRVGGCAEREPRPVPMLQGEGRAR